MDTTRSLHETVLDAGIRAWLDAAVTPGGEDAERKALDALRHRQTEAAEALTRAYFSRPNDHALRWALVRCASDLETSGAGAFLVQVVDAEIPRESSHDVHQYSSVAEEATQRMQAVRGLGVHARRGDPVAVGALVRAFHHPIAAVRHAAYSTVMSLPEDVRTNTEVRDGLRVLSDEFGDLFVADIREHPLPEEDVSLAPRVLAGPPDEGRSDREVRAMRRSPIVRHIGRREQDDEERS